MGLVDGAGHVADIHVGIDLSRCQGGMPQQFLDNPDICLSLQQVSGTGVAQAVTVAFHSQSFEISTNDRVYSLSVDRPA